MNDLMQAAAEWPAGPEALAKLTALLGLVWAAFLIARSGRLARLLWRLAGVAVVVLPLVALLGPRWEAAVLPAEEDEVVTVRPAHEGFVEARAIEAAPRATVAPAAGSIKPMQGGVELPRVFFFIWAMGALALLARMAWQGRRARRLMQRTEPAPETIQAECAAVMRALGCGREVAVRVLDEPVSPFVIGWRRPAIVLPRRILEGDFAVDRPAVFAHELAHVAEADLKWMGFLRGLGALLWFHPLWWRAGEAHAAACERVGDAAAAQYVGDAGAYARTLARIALELEPPRALGLAIAMARRARIRRRLDWLARGRRERSLSWPRRVSIAVAFMALALGLASVRVVEAEGDTGPKGEGLVVVQAEVDEQPLEIMNFSLLPLMRGGEDPEAFKKFAWSVARSVRLFLFADQDRYGSADAPRHWFDEGTMSLVIVHTPENLQRVQQYMESLAELEREVQEVVVDSFATMRASGDQSVRAFRINADRQDWLTEVQEIAIKMPNSYPKIKRIGLAGDSMVVVSPTESLDWIEARFREEDLIDTSPSKTGEALETRQYSLIPESVENISSSQVDVFCSRVVESIETFLYHETSRSEAVEGGRHLWFDEAARQLVIIDTDERLNRVEEYLHSLPELNPKPDLETRHYSIYERDASAIRQLINELSQSKPFASSAEEYPPAIVDGNQLYIRNTPEALDRIENQLKDNGFIYKNRDMKLGIRSFELVPKGIDNIHSEQVRVFTDRVVESIETFLYKESGRREAWRQGRRSWFDEAAKELIVIDTPEKLDRVEKYLQSLPELGPRRRQEVIYLKFVAAEEFAPQIEKLLDEEYQKASETPGFERPDFEIKPLNELNALLIRSDEVVLEDIVALVKEFDKPLRQLELDTYWLYLGSDAVEIIKELTGGGDLMLKPLSNDWRRSLDGRDDVEITAGPKVTALEGEEVEFRIERYTSKVGSHEAIILRLRMDVHSDDDFVVHGQSIEVLHGNSSGRLRESMQQRIEPYTVPEPGVPYIGAYIPGAERDSIVVFVMTLVDHPNHTKDRASGRAITGGIRGSK